MDRDRKRRIWKIVGYVAAGVVIADAGNRLAAYFAEGDTEIFDQLLLITTVLIPAAGAIRIFRIYRRG